MGTSYQRLHCWVTVADLVTYVLLPTRMLLSLWDLDLHGFQDTVVFDGSQLLLSTGINMANAMA